MTITAPPNPALAAGTRSLRRPRVRGPRNIAPQRTLTTAEAAALALPAAVTWRPNVEGAHLATAAASVKLLNRELYDVALFRQPDRYPRQKNIQGLYFFTGTRTHIWHESQLEAQVLRWLDMREDIVALSTQPMRIDFADGTSHTPDILTLHSDHRQVLRDVKPKKYIPKFQEQFAKTRAFCEHVGFKYEVHHELPRQVDINLSWIAGFKHHGYRPQPADITRMLTALDGPISLRAVARLLAPADLAQGRAGLFNLIWSGQLSIDLAHPISDRSPIERTTS
ncbi:TnsA-like heteromeric transposase endonuclease subunit [Curtobacterium flaccumfaciens]|uniref:TnsA-like heteromeric transposase endonuclease subunit n=1 Tax=Curtobacterium flaccumfaciens TaxID=2035 RepID=UPI0021C75758|nr:TnsA-like heteromeric transposase endonuclease subunit [Curtobacterium flaccumfaciens]UXN21151.1 TnsA-like heteromeric transposase endonuclease subunit [Curtobacterium flaccumfaciens pv. flaccumfaciens]